MKTTLMTMAAIAAVDARMGFGQCPAVDSESNFDMSRHEGKWFEQQRDKLFTFEMGQECGTQIYRANAAGNYDLYFRAEIPMMFGQYVGVNGEMSQCGQIPTSEGSCMATMNGGDKKSPIKILATDYDNWSVLYACMDMVGGDLMYANWLSISTRTNAPISEEHLMAAHAAIRAQLPLFDLSNWAMYNTTQGRSCQYDWNIWETKTF